MTVVDVMTTYPPSLGCRLQVGNPLRDSGVGLKDAVSLLEALVRGFSKACPWGGPHESGEPGMVDAWRR